MSFRGKAAVVVGGTGGIGSETARHLLLEGVEVRRNNIPEDVSRFIVSIK